MKALSVFKLNEKSLKWYLNFVFIASLLLIFFTRLLIYLKYNLNYIDSDQAYMWAGALDYSKGHFYEPRFYAQDYNTFMEALFAVPLLWLNVKPYYAVPLATHFIALFPYIFTSVYLFVKQQKIQAILVLALVICMPIENDLLNALPRGFVTGLFFCSFFVVNILNPNNLLFFALNACLAVIGFFVNPNSALVSLPFCFYIFLHQPKNIQFYKTSIIPILLIYPMHLFFNQFYINHPDYVLHPLEYQFSFQKYFWDNMNNLDQRFAHICLFTVKNCIILLFVFFVMLVTSFFQNKKAFFTLIVFICFLFFSFCFGKTAEGSTWVYGSYSRMYLGLPILMALIIPLIKFKWSNQLLFLLMLPTVFAANKIVKMDQDLKWHLTCRGGVILLEYKNMLNLIDFYKKACENTNTNFLLVSSHFWANTTLSCAAKTLDENFPECSETFAEKRYWLREKNKTLYLKEFVFISSDFHVDESWPINKGFEFQKLDLFGLYLIKNNQLSMSEFIELINKTDHTN